MENNIDVNILENLKNYLENQKKQFDKDTYLYEGIEHNILIVNTIININKHKSKVVGSFKKFRKRFRKS